MLLVAAAGLAPPAPVLAGAERGQLLYENHCTGCHASTVHVRSQRKAKAPADVRAWILRWSGELKLAWKDDERADVYRYLNDRYYKFPVETPGR
jgi:mono/diheme cytochrome c family protein